MTKRISMSDHLISQLDRALKTLIPKSNQSQTPNPANNKSCGELTEQEKNHAAGLMRVNHTGEVCAQALYQGQALTAKLENVRDTMEKAADEEIDHLVWCEQRLEELDSRPSLLNPIFYGLSFSIGAIAGKIGDKYSLGFVAATEDQVCLHIEDHLEKLPPQDQKSSAILKQMLEDEARHATTALESGGISFPPAIQKTMTLVSKVMTNTTYRI